MDEPREIILLSSAQRALAEAKTVDEVKDLRDKAVAVKAYAKKARLGKDLVVDASISGTPRSCAGSDASEPIRGIRQ